MRNSSSLFCGCCRTYPYKKTVNAVYPSKDQAADVMARPVGSENLAKYALRHDEHLVGIVKMLESRIRRDLRKMKYGYVAVGISVLSTIIEMCRDNLGQFEDHIFNLLNLLLDHDKPEIRIMAYEMFVKLCQNKGGDKELNRIYYDAFVPVVVRDCHYESIYRDIKLDVQQSVLKLLQQLIMRCPVLLANQLLPTLVPHFMDVILETPTAAADQLVQNRYEDIRNLAFRCLTLYVNTGDNTSDLLRPLFHYLDEHFWEPADFSLSILRSVCTSRTKDAFVVPLYFFITNHIEEICDLNFDESVSSGDRESTDDDKNKTPVQIEMTNMDHISKMSQTIASMLKCCYALICEMNHFNIFHVQSSMSTFVSLIIHYQSLLPSKLQTPPSLTMPSSIISQAPVSGKSQALHVVPEMKGQDGSLPSNPSDVSTPQQPPPSTQTNIESSVEDQPDELAVDQPDEIEARSSEDVKATENSLTFSMQTTSGSLTVVEKLSNEVSPEPTLSTSEQSSINVIKCARECIIALGRRTRSKDFKVVLEYVVIGAFDYGNETNQSDWFGLLITVCCSQFLHQHIDFSDSNDMLSHISDGMISPSSDQRIMWLNVFCIMMQFAPDKVSIGRIPELYLPHLYSVLYRCALIDNNTPANLYAIERVLSFMLASGVLAHLRWLIPMIFKLQVSLLPLVLFDSTQRDIIEYTNSCSLNKAISPSFNQMNRSSHPLLSANQSQSPFLYPSVPASLKARLPPDVEESFEEEEGVEAGIVPRQDPDLDTDNSDFSKYRIIVPDSLIAGIMSLILNLMVEVGRILNSDEIMKYSSTIQNRRNEMKWMSSDSSWKSLNQIQDFAQFSREGSSKVSSVDGRLFLFKKEYIIYQICRSPLLLGLSDSVPPNFAELLRSEFEPITVEREEYHSSSSLRRRSNSTSSEHSGFNMNRSESERIGGVTAYYDDPTNDMDDTENTPVLFEDLILRQETLINTRKEKLGFLASLSTTTTEVLYKSAPDSSPSIAMLLM